MTGERMWFAETAVRAQVVGYLCVCGGPLSTQQRFSFPGQPDASWFALRRACCCCCDLTRTVSAHCPVSWLSPTSHIPVAYAYTHRVSRYMLISNLFSIKHRFWVSEKQNIWKAWWNLFANQLSLWTQACYWLWENAYPGHKRPRPCKIGRLKKI
jgi:hypothetical protein